jgi:hypothetical protein
MVLLVLQVRLNRCIAGTTEQMEPTELMVLQVPPSLYPA